MYEYMLAGVRFQLLVCAIVLAKLGGVKTLNRLYIMLPNPYALKSMVLDIIGPALYVISSKQKSLPRSSRGL